VKIPVFRKGSQTNWLLEFCAVFNGPRRTLTYANKVPHCSATATDIGGQPCEYRDDIFARVGAWCGK
jgi:hypothetical protein